MHETARAFSRDVAFVTDELRNDPQFLQANWRAERVGWMCIAAIVLAGLTGALGRGPISNVVTSRGALRVEYDRVMRRSAPGKITIHVDGDSGAPLTSATERSEPAIRVWMTQRVLSGCNPRQLQPAPARMTADRDTAVLTLAVASPTSEASATIECSPDATGRYDGAIGLFGGPRIPIRILVLP